AFTGRNYCGLLNTQPPPVNPFGTIFSLSGSVQRYNPPTLSAFRQNNQGRPPLIFKLVQYTVMGIAVFYAAEGTGLIARGQYCPSLPRLEATASDPMAWLGAAQWGFSQLGQFASSRGASFDTGSIASIGNRNFDS